MTFNEIRQALVEVETTWELRVPDLLFSNLSALMASAVACKNQEEAKLLWCLEQSLRIQTAYIQAFKQCKAGSFYEAWCTLERVEGMILPLKRHLPESFQKDFKIDFIEAHTKKLQSLFPYGIFLSPEFIRQKTYCNICEARISLRNHCGHRTGEIYDGKLCGRIIKTAEIAGLALVKNPVQKYSIPFTSDPTSGERVDQYNYEVVEYLAKALVSPFHYWDVSKEKRRHPHSFFKDVGRNAKCPCESDKKYKHCCLPTEGVLRPHFQFHFSVAPPPDLMKRKYVY